MCAVVKPDSEGLAAVQKEIDAVEVVIGFNIKFDLHWLRKYGILFQHKRIRDTQVIEFVLSRQTKSYPSLDETAFQRLGEKKLDVVKTEYWDYGVQTDQIPWEVLSQYAAKDVELTYKVYLSQMEEIMQKKSSMWPVINLACNDTLALQECEWNGQRYDREASLHQAEDVS